jgi:hypothetical protein
MKSDLRTWWSSASPRERDAKVAEALGWFMVGPREELNGAVWGKEPAQDSKKWAVWKEVEHYTTSWEHAGPLLSRLTVDGWEYVALGIFDDGSGRIELRQQADSKNPDIHVELERRELPEVVALAFCLAKEAQP